MMCSLIGTNVSRSQSIAVRPSISGISPEVIFKKFKFFLKLNFSHPWIHEDLSRKNKNVTQISGILSKNDSFTNDSFEFIVCSIYPPPFFYIFFLRVKIHESQFF